MPTFEEVVARKQEVEQHYLALPGVTGIDVGFKEVGGRTTAELSIRVHVAQKKDRVPAAERVPADIDGIVTDVLERNYELQVVSHQLDVSAQADTTHYAALEGGISMGPSRAIGGFIFAGTLGAIVMDNANNQRAALTNFHVACVDNSWHVGDRMVQPSRIDTGSVPADEFGAIVRATLSSNVDGAVISVDSGKSTSCQVVEIGQVRGTKAATLGMSVRKRGRTTGLTYGSVDGLASTVNIDYGDGIGVRTLSNQVSIKADTTRNALFSDHGDSGSVIVDDSGYVVGLLFAGAGAGTIANPIAAVLSELNVAICTGKLIIKDLKDGLKDFIKDKDKELRKDVIKDKEVIKDRKDLIKDKEWAKEQVKEKDHKELRKDLLPDNKRLKDVVDHQPKRIGDNWPIPDPGPVDPGPFDPGPFEPGPRNPGTGALEQRLAALEQQLGALSSFITSDLRPDLSTGAFAQEPDLSEEELSALREELTQQAAAAASAKAEFDTPTR